MLRSHLLHANSTWSRNERRAQQSSHTRKGALLHSYSWFVQLGDWGAGVTLSSCLLCPPCLKRRCPSSEINKQLAWRDRDGLQDSPFTRKKKKKGCRNVVFTPSAENVCPNIFSRCLKKSERTNKPCADWQRMLMCMRGKWSKWTVFLPQCFLDPGINKRKMGESRGRRGERGRQRSLIKNLSTILWKRIYEKTSTEKNWLYILPEAKS